ncbi:hypothetical protein GM3708_3622 (plasmid) [Geminocystis sp. NIES-3708]|uniref:S1 family peptidase n=1 Tax=Geminocystis sp. NIES-3708 TaxID=1615909 RepID=UPI0005FC417E|nr:serine protease [Geminocystis sp. NIES-3708]BAQ63216.1 hypothetical protein GM3708_3622 [Geminocystis sp. NIES-3708]
MNNYSIPDIIDEVKSGIIQIVHEKNGVQLSSGTGFMANGYLVTNYHVIYNSSSDSEIIFRKCSNNSVKELMRVENSKDIELYYTEVGIGIEKENNDYLVLKLPKLANQNLYNFQLDSHKNKRIGEQILFLGYHFGQDRITAHNGFISSFYQSNNVDVIQIDGSINNGASGSPLIDPITKKVIGIVTRKEDGFTKIFKQIEKIISQNNELSSSMPSNTLQILGSKSLVDIPMQVKEINSSLLELMKQIKRSANVGIGYAFSVEQLMKENCFIID